MKCQGTFSKRSERNGSPKFCGIEVKANFECGAVQKRVNLTDLAKMLQNEPLLAKIGCDTAENGPSKIWATNTQPPATNPPFFYGKDTPPVSSGQKNINVHSQWIHRDSASVRRQAGGTPARQEMISTWPGIRIRRCTHPPLRQFPFRAWSRDGGFPDIFVAPARNGECR